jgi:protein-tyrosine-phosphatase
MMEVILKGAQPQLTPDVVQFFKALADETRLTIVRLLMRSDLRAGEVVERLQLPANIVSYHLKQLRSLGLLRDRRSSLDGRDVYYSVDLARLHALYATAGDALHPGIHAQEQVEDEDLPRIERPIRILFLCTHNRARSQLAEGLTRYLAGPQVEVYSAGSEPTEVHPLTIEVLGEMGVDTSTLVAKSMDEFCGRSFDYVITTCDKVRGGCPTLPGDPEQVHWSFEDPSAVQGGKDAQRQAFRTARREMLTRIRYLLSLPHPVTGERLKLRGTTRYERGAA